MFRFLGAGVLALTLAGCATSDGPQWWRTLAGLSSAPGHYRFDWHIEGDPSLAPLQVFDDGRRTWLQYPANQLAPALFERTAAGDRLLHPEREGDYLVIQGVPERLVVRGGHLQAQIWRDGAVGGSAAGGLAPSAEPSGAVAPGPSAPLGALIEPAAAIASPLVPIPASASSVPLVAPAAASAASAHAVVPASPLPPMPSPTSPPPSSLLSSPPPVPLRAGPMPSHAAGSPGRRPSTSSAPVADRARRSSPFEATPADGNIRRALGRWARSAGWAFESEHWAVDVDIPLAGSAAFGDEFVPAVRGLLAATELGDRPLQPCFYANQVLRVIPLAQRCDRTQLPGASS